VSESAARDPQPREALVALPAQGRVFHGEAAAGLSDCAPGGRARLDAIAGWLQDVAYRDGAEVGMFDDGLWLARRTRIEVQRFPRLDERCTLRTFCSGLGSLWAERRTTIGGVAGGRVEAAAVWVYLERASERPSPPPERFHGIYAPSAAGRRVRARLEHPTEPPAGAACTPWRFRAADVDIAGHVNNTVYWELVEEQLPADAPEPLAAEVEHRAAATAGTAELAVDAGRGWIVGEDGELLATTLIDRLGA
jgi:acyl-ACP thioesterase